MNYTRTASHLTCQRDRCKGLADVATDVCVETGTREGFVRDYYIAFLSDGMATPPYQISRPPYFRNADRYFDQVASITDVVNGWTVQPQTE
jgi:nicotinamidase-related amidase